ncbi:MAG: tagaturonate epimerase family protein [Opitutales bacterium]
MKKLPRFTFGMGDRFGQQGEAQLQAVLDGRAQGIELAPVWNKSQREHSLVGTEPKSLRVEADAAVAALDYSGPYFVDADHINFETVDAFLECSDFFTMDVAEDLGKPPESPEAGKRYQKALLELGRLELEGIESALQYDAAAAEALVNNYGGAVEAARKLYEKIRANRSDDDFAVEVSMDETDEPQGPKELLGILAMLAIDGVPAQTIAPKFSGRFNKGVEYVGDTEQFRREFEADLVVLRYAIEALGLPDTLKLSVHSGSDKFSLYPIIRELVAKHEAGLHLKTAGTTWLEEVIGLAEAGGEALKFVQQLYADALDQMDALTAPYESVLDIDLAELPSREELSGWGSGDFVRNLAHDPSEPRYNPSLRQLLHVAFKLAAKSGDRYHNLLKKHAGIVNRRVHENLYHKHITKVFPCGDVVDFQRQSNEVCLYDAQERVYPS